MEKEKIQRKVYTIHEYTRTLPTPYVSTIRLSKYRRGVVVLNIFVDNRLSILLSKERKNVDLPNIFGIINSIFAIESDRSD